MIGKLPLRYIPTLSKSLKLFSICTCCGFLSLGFSSLYLVLHSNFCSKLFPKFSAIYAFTKCINQQPGKSQMPITNMAAIASLSVPCDPFLAITWPTHFVMPELTRRGSAGFSSYSRYLHPCYLVYPLSLWTSEAPCSLLPIRLPWDNGVFKYFRKGKQARGPDQPCHSASGHPGSGIQWIADSSNPNYYGSLNKAQMEGGRNQGWNGWEKGWGESSLGWQKAVIIRRAAPRCLWALSHPQKDGGAGE
jgi:hypothetical protein